MAITAKPFDAFEKIRRREFKPKTNVFSHVDINQETEAIVDAIEKISDRLGARLEGYALTVNSLTLTKPSTLYKVEYDIDFSPVSGFVYAKNVRFEVPATVLASPLGGVEGTGADILPQVDFYLVAKKKTVTFLDDNVMAGIDGTGFPAPLPSSDAIVWEGERIATFHNGSIVGTLGGSEEVICKLFSIGYEDIAYTGATIPYSPEVLFMAPEVSGGNEFSQQIMETLGLSTLESATEHLAALWFKLDNVNSKVNTYINLLNLFDVSAPSLDDMLQYSETAGVNKFRPVAINTILHDREHTFNKRVTLSSGTSTTGYRAVGPSSMHIVLGNHINNLVIEANDDTVLDDIISLHVPAVGIYPAYDIPVKTGTFVFLDITLNDVNPTFWGSNFTPLSDPYNKLDTPTTRSVIGNWILYKTATTWVFASATTYITDKLSYYKSLIDTVTTLANTTASTVATLLLQQDATAVATTTTYESYSTSPVVIKFGTDVDDPNSWFNNANGKFTPLRAGKYDVDLSGYINALGTITNPGSVTVTLKKNGSAIKILCSSGVANHSGYPDQVPASGYYRVTANGTTDYFEVEISRSGFTDWEFLGTVGYKFVRP